MIYRTANITYRLPQNHSNVWEHTRHTSTPLSPLITNVMLLAVSFRSLSHKYNKFHHDIEEFPISQLKQYVFISASSISTQTFVISTSYCLPTFKCWQPCTWKKKYHGVIASGAKHNSSIRLSSENFT